MGKHLFAIIIEEIGWNNTKDKTKRVFIYKTPNFGEGWLFNYDINGNTERQKFFKTKPHTLAYAKRWMREHPNG